MGKKADFGAELLFFYPISNRVYEKAIRSYGLRSWTRANEQENTNFYADNEVHKTISGENVISGDWISYQIEDDVKTKLLGFRENENRAFTDGNDKQRFGSVYAVKHSDQFNRERYKLIVNYDCLFSSTSGDNVTTEDAVELLELTTPYTAKKSDFVKDDVGNGVSYMEVILPTSVSKDDLISFLEEGMPTPQSGIWPEATLEAGTTTNTVDTVYFNYTYSSNVENIESSAACIFKKDDVADEDGNIKEIARIQPLTESTDVVEASFADLEADTSYYIKLISDELHILELLEVKTAKTAKVSTKEAVKEDKK